MLGVLLVLLVVLVLLVLLEAVGPQGPIGVPPPAVIDGSNAASGTVGEFPSVTVLGPAAVAVVSGGTVDVCSIALPPGTGVYRVRFG